MGDYSTFSIRLSNCLEMIIGNEEEVMKRRRVIDVMSFYIKGPPRYIDLTHTGSKAEGFDLKGSDVDQMIVLPDIKVVDSITRETSDNNILYVNIRYSLESPGSVLLEALDLNLWSSQSNFAECIVNALVPCRGFTLLSSSLLCEQFVFFMNIFGMTKLLKSELNGPCLTTVTSTNDSTDLAFALNHRIWPKVATEWISRHRPHGWPSPSLVSSIVQGGCHLVAVGDGHSRNSDFLWRISFTCAEVKLVRSLNFVQFKTYGLLKILLKDVFKKYQTKDEPLLCSYFMKTIIFYAVENSPICLWIEPNLFRCFWMCLNMLIDFVFKGYLPNYFIPANNLFRKRLNGRNRFRLLSILQRYRNKGSNCIFDSSILRESFHEPFLYASPEFKEGVFDRYINVSVHKDINRFTDTHPVFKMLLNSNVDIDVYISLAYLCQVLHCKATECLYSCYNSVNNKNIYFNYRRYRKYLTFNANIDASRGWLYLATYHYMIGQYRQALELCRHVVSSVSPSTMYTGVRLHPESYIQRWCGRGSQLHLKSKYAFMEHIIIKTFDICPEELRRELNADQRGGTILIPLSYASFLSCLCYLHIGDRVNMQGAIEDLKAYILFENEVLNDPTIINSQFNLLRAFDRIAGYDEN